MADLIAQAIQQGTYRFTVANAGDADVEVHLPQSLVAYLQGVGASLLTVDLAAYLSSIEATQSTDTRLREAQRGLALARQAVRNGEIDAVALQDALSPLRSLLAGYVDHPAGSRAQARLSSLIDRTSDPSTVPAATDARSDLEYLDAALRELRLGTTIGLASA